MGNHVLIQLEHDHIQGNCNQDFTKIVKYSSSSLGPRASYKDWINKSRD